VTDEVFDPGAILSILVRRGVRFVVIGGLAGNLRGTPVVTYDLDVCYARTDEDLARMSAALDALHARLRVAREDAELDFPLDERSLRRGDSFTLTTDLGPFDILGTPSGTAGYADLDAGATEFDLGDGVRVRVASVDDLIRMKRASARAKDHAQLAHLEALREEIDQLREDGTDPQQGR
jgi:hypothetical protein